MKIVEGKIVNDKGEVQVLEFGNTDQIKLLKNIEKYQQGVEVDYITTRYSVSLMGECMCENELYKEYNNIDEACIKGISCSKCKSKYSIIYDDNNNQMFIKLK